MTPRGPERFPAAIEINIFLYPPAPTRQFNLRVKTGAPDGFDRRALDVTPAKRSAG
jgi:hypothetical protein